MFHNFIFNVFFLYYVCRLHGGPFGGRIWRVERPFYLFYYFFDIFFLFNISINIFEMVFYINVSMFAGFNKNIFIIAG